MEIVGIHHGEHLDCCMQLREEWFRNNGYQRCALEVENGYAGADAVLGLLLVAVVKGRRSDAAADQRAQWGEPFIVVAGVVISPRSGRAHGGLGCRLHEGARTHPFRALAFMGGTMRRKLVLLALLGAILTSTASPAGAITGNYQKDFIHPYVGLVVFYDADGEFSHRCSGTLLSPSVFLTAGHCTEGVSTARVYFEQDAGAHYDPELGYDPITGYPLTGGVTSDELYNYGFDDFQGFPNTRDVGLVILDEPVQLAEYASLAVAGSLDELATRRGQQEVTFTISGYGLSLTNPNVDVSFRERLMATTRLINLRSALTSGYNIQLSANPGGGRGGTCFGDSGGPVFYDATNVIVAVTSFGLNSNCRGVDFAYRTDQTDVIEWILSHAPADERDDISIVSI